MIKLIFNNPIKSQVLGPAPSFRIMGNFICQGPDMRIVAIYRQRFWEMRKGIFVRYDCFDAAKICFEDKTGSSSECFGPFDHVWSPNGVLYAGEKAFAKFNEVSQLWHCLSIDRYWPVLVIMEAQGSS